MFIHVFYKTTFFKTYEIDLSDSKIKSLGRNEDNDLSCPFDNLISSRHAEFFLKGNRIFIKDLNSKNGIFFEDKRIKDEFIDLEKKVSIGNSTFIFSENKFKEIKKTVYIDDSVFNELLPEKESSNKSVLLLYNLSKDLMQHSDENKMLNYVLEELIKIYNLDRVLYFKIKDNKANYYLDKVIDKRFSLPNTEFSKSILNEIVNTHKAVFIQNVSNKNIKINDSANFIGVNSLIAFPVIISNRLYAVIQLEYFSIEKSFQKEDLYLLALLSQILSNNIKDLITIENVRNEKDLYKEQVISDNQIIGEHEKTVFLRSIIQKLAKSDTRVLITGESGTGKELVARNIHFLSRRKIKPFIAINCASIPENLIESEFFGHMKGAFTGADTKRIGKIEAANGGTLFLDEIGDMALSLQAKLLRFLELGEYQLVGSNETKYADVRIIAATNKDLKKFVADNKFRDDLYYRLTVFQINCPSLKERGNDIIELVNYFIKKFNFTLSKNIKTISKDAEKALLQYSWPGNIRELKNIVERACVIGEGTEITKELIPEDIFSVNASCDDNIILPLYEVEKNYILKVLKMQNFNKAQTASLLGVTRKTLYSKLHLYKIL